MKSGLWLGALVGFVAFVVLLDLDIVKPAEVEWLMRGDWQIHFLGWHSYRTGAWTLPLGANPSLGYPVGTSVGLTDSIPVFAFLFKPISPLLPPLAQYVGLWLFICYLLQGLFGVLLMRLVTNRLLLQVLGAAMFVLSPTFITRLGHPALAAHWLILASLWWALRPAPSRPLAFLGGWLVICGVTAATHPYLALMVLAVMGAAYAGRVIAAPRQVIPAASELLVIVCWVGFVQWQAGYFLVGSGEDLQSVGNGDYSMNLLALFMPNEFGTIVPHWMPYASRGQYEGYMYAGAGVLLLAAASLASLVAVRAPRPFAWAGRRHLPLAFAFLFLTVLAVSPTVTWGRWTLFTYDPEWLGPFLLFRASGRLFWPVFYALVLGVIAGALRFRPQVSLVLLATAVVLQGLDLTGIGRNTTHIHAFQWEDPLDDSFWDEVPGFYRRLKLWPTNMCSNEPTGYENFVLVAGRHGLAINAGAAARYDTRAVTEYCRWAHAEYEAGIVEADTLYVLSRELLPGFANAAGERAACMPVDDHVVCVAPSTYGMWQDRYDMAAEVLPPVVDFVSEHRDLDEEYRRMGRGEAALPGTAADRAGALRRYLAYRITGCGHDQARDKVLREAGGQPEVRLCGNPVVTREPLPGREDAVRFQRELDAFLRQSERSLTATALDVEGEGVWLYEYAQARLAGQSDEQAQASVREMVRAAVAAQPAAR